jgi:murein DD-endopeptidase MepM/ murein hydrolase activator NlpD
MSRKKIFITLLICVVLGLTLHPPVEGGKVSSMYGPRFKFDRVFHKGTDIAAPTGTPITSISWGKVSSRGFCERGGNYVMITHFPGLQSRYFHLDAINVSVGQEVTPQTKIGTVGNTGVSTGPHLHFEIRLFEIPLPPYLLCFPGKLVSKVRGRN